MRTPPLWQPPWMQGKAQRPAPPAPMPAAVLQELEEAFQNRPFGSFGEMVVPAAEPPPPPVEDRGLQIEPPPWAGEIPVPTLPELAPPMDALGEMKRQLGDVAEPRFTPGPALKMTAPEKFEPPAVDWEEEKRLAIEREQAERERLAREQRAELLQQLLDEAENHEAYPAKRRQKT